MKKKILKYQLVVIFLLMLVLPWLIRVVGLDDFPRRDENRVFHDSLTLDIARLDYFPDDCESYLNDNFFFRTPLLNIFHKMKFSVFNVSPHPDKTRIGKDGWYFMAGKELQILNGNLDFSPKVLDSFTNEWKERTNYLKQLDIPVFWIIAPIKHRVYSEKLPYNVHISKTNRIIELQHHLQIDFPNLIINPLKTLREHKDENELYFRLDNHWNLHAGYLTTQLLIERLRVAFPNKEIIDIPPLHWKTEVIQKGYHYNVLGIDNLREYKDIPVVKHPQSIEAKKYGFEPEKGFPYPWAYESRYVNDSLKNGLRVLFIRDSFGAALQPFAREVFKESEFIFDSWQFKLNKSIIKRYQPDVIVYVGLEKNVKNFLRTYDRE